MMRGETERGWKPQSKCSSSTSAEVAADVAQWYGCLLDKQVYDTPSTRAQFTYSHHFSEWIAATQHMLGLLHNLHCVLNVLASAHVTESGDAGAGEENSSVWRYRILSSLSPPLILSLSLSLYTNHLLYFSSGLILAIWYFGCHLSLLSDLPLIILSPTQFSAFFFLNFLPPPHWQHLNQLNCQKPILLSPHTHTHTYESVLTDSHPLKWKRHLLCGW